MTRKPKRLTPLESVVMDCIWALPEATVRQVQEHLEPTRPMAYNTVLTVMRILRDKGFLASRREGRLDLYRPAVSRHQVATHSLHELLHRFFAGSAQALVSQLLESEELTPKEIHAIRREIEGKLENSRR
jgi:predicted transcriptional regulator